jgi:hypothetical protein
VTTGPTSQCGTCVHFISPFSDRAQPGATGPACDAFPAGIPDVVYRMGVDHRQPVDGDQGVRWSPRPGMAYPEQALAAP